MAEDVAAVTNDGFQKSAERSKKMTSVSAYDFSRDYAGRYQLGITRAAVAKTLRELADDFENNNLLPYRAQVTTEAYRADYTRSVLILEFSQRRSDIEDAPGTAT